MKFFHDFMMKTYISLKIFVTLIKNKRFLNEALEFDRLFVRHFSINIHIRFKI
jgi:hypothetical protein